MPAQKQITVQAATFDGVVVFNKTIWGKRFLRSLQIEALDELQRKGGGFLRSQTVGAKGWAIFTAGVLGAATQTFTEEWPAK